MRQVYILAQFAVVVLAITRGPVLAPRPGTCNDHEGLCNGGCIPSGYTCCPDSSGGCPAGRYCDKGNNGKYGCCIEGIACTGDGGVGTSTDYYSSTSLASNEPTRSRTTSWDVPSSTVSQPSQSTSTGGAISQWDERRGIIANTGCSLAAVLIALFATIFL